jgi:hypothetical protein
MKKHAFDPLSFVAGAIFLIIAVAAVLETNVDYRLSKWALPASVLVLGVGLLAASFRGMRKDSGQEAEDLRPQTSDLRPEADDHGPGADGDTLVG